MILTDSKIKENYTGLRGSKIVTEPERSLKWKRKKKVLVPG